jgi:DNA-binding MarR family transcriptional regulator
MKTETMKQGMTTSFRKMNEAIRSHQQSLVKMVVLEECAKNTVSLSALSYRAAMTKPALTMLCDALVKAGDLVRVYSPADRRRVFLRITTQGNNRLKRVIEQLTMEVES